MKEQICNACVLQNWTFDNREEAEAWLRRQRDRNCLEVLFSGQFCENGWQMTVCRRYGSAPMMRPFQIFTIGTLIVDYEFDHVAAPEVE